MDEENSFSMQLLIDALGRGPWVQKLPWLDEENTDGVQNSRNTQSWRQKTP
jgi:hypothetical protein